MENTMKQLPPKPVDLKKRIYHWAIAIVTIVVIVWSCIGINFGRIKESAGQITGAIFAGIFHPDRKPPDLWEYGSAARLNLWC